MKITSFRISNFKGIHECQIKIQDEAPGNIVTLIGLNESGKTTILEAISNFLSEDDDLSSLYESVTPRKPLTDFVPKGRKDNFSDSIDIVAEITLDEFDVSSLKNHLYQKFELQLNEDDLDYQFCVTRSFNFSKSNHVETQSLWTIRFPLKTKRAQKFRSYGASGPTREVWLSGIRHLGRRFPKICFFPTFLTEFPDRIYLEEHETETPINYYYRRILQDVLDAHNEGLTLEEHIVDRIRKAREIEDNPALFWFAFFSKDEKSQIDSVLRKMSAQISSVVFGAWNEIFDRHNRNRSISIEWSVDVDQGNIPYVQMYVMDGQSQYAISERSLGFRWFFCFLLFTQFRASRREINGTFFLFDEPASNLHSRAQAQLLKSFPKIASAPNFIIYSTHSQYMIEPLWLEKAYIVENTAIEYDAPEDQIDYFSTKDTDVRATRYRRFVGENPTRSTYFQPVLDKLDYVEPSVIGSGNCIILEGKYDFYMLKYFKDVENMDTKLDLLPGVGAEKSDLLISSYLGMGRKFIVLLDDDSAGKRAKSRYLNDYLLGEQMVLTLGDIDAKWKGKKLEGLLSDKMVEKIKQHFSTKRRPSKKQVCLFFQEMTIAEKKNIADSTTKKNIKGLFATLSEKLA